MTRWYLGGIGAAIAIGWIAARVHLAGFAPLGLVSLAVGLMLGAAIVAVAKWSNTQCGRRLIVGTAGFALIAVATVHVLLYGDFRRQWHSAQAAVPQVSLFRGDDPWSPGEYFAKEATPRRVTLWIADAALVTGAALGVVLVWQRRRV